eukprot:m.342261 g.342261  ORF g.342261 m.342261 type:complete len:158 (-) comp16121_c0_seq16:491-964(-)
MSYSTYYQSSNMSNDNCDCDGIYANAEEALGTAENIVGRTYNTDIVSVVSSGLIAGGLTYYMKSNEPIYQGIAMAVAQFTGVSIHDLLVRLGYMDHKPDDQMMEMIHKSAFSIGLFSIIVWQMGYESDWINILKIALPSSTLGEVLQMYGKQYKYIN